MVAPFSVVGGSFQAGKPREWSDGRYQTRGSTRMFALHVDGQRFALAPATPASGDARQDSLVFIFNFADDLRRITSAAKN